MKLNILALLASAVLLWPLSAFTEGDAQAGRDKSFTCSGCHAVAGMRNAYPAYTVPKLGGQNADYLKEALRAYRDGNRQHPTMHAQTAQFSDQDLEDIAAYFSTLANE